MTLPRPRTRSCNWPSLAAAPLLALSAGADADALTNGLPAIVSPNPQPAWEFSAAAMAYFVPDSREYVQPTFTADREWLHLEARYNYEALETGSAWAGYNLAGGEAVSWSITPMLGAVFGNTTGFAPGYKGSLAWWKLELYSEGEYVFVPGDASDSFFYNWSELSLSPWDWLRFGLVTQRTRVYDSDRDIQRGFLLDGSYHGFDLTGYLFNPDESRPTFVLALALSF